jgi:lipopolysaccharide/colanic/teichoic acid biosynthesis glycosyltransferase
LRRLVDVLAASFGLFLLSPVFAAAAAAIWLSMGRPVIFRQLRPGLHGRPFTIYKFRTMKESVAADGLPLPDRDRLTDLGRFLRSWSVDELPELWNVLKGDMSLIGPRPLLMEYLPLYTRQQARRHEVRPGLTGWAQVQGRNAISWDEKFVMDVWYVDHRNLWIDLKILWRTFVRVLQRHGIDEEGGVGQERFRGNGA